MTDSSPNTVSAGFGSDVKVAVVGALMPFGAGVVVLAGYLWLDIFGIVLAAAAGIWWAVWWRRKHHGKFFPREVENGPFAVTIVIVAVLLIAALASM